MKNSSERIKFIANYISAYEENIKSLNNNGLFDSAKLFELFAIEVGGLYLGQKLFNLNIDTYTYPCVDLISKDKNTYIQVSTVKDIPSKIKLTLEKIKDSKLEEISNLKNIKFFVLNNESVDKVKDYTEDDKIGNVSFVKANDLITTKDILQKATTDLNFQINLYQLLKQETENIKDNSCKFQEAITISKTLINNNIDCLINNEYEIDRTEEINQIRKECKNFISVQGEAGSGKSALCKKMLANEEFLLYARAEKISEARKLEDIWNLDITKVIKYLNHQKLFIYIDALEFIADAPKTKLDLLQQLYETVKDYSNIFVITSCRSSDRTAFIKIENIYDIKKHEVSLLSDNQIINIAQKYKIIQDLWEAKSYIQLLRSPFYLNLTIKEIKNFKKIDDVDSFRNLIWTDIICMKGKSLPNGIKHSDIKNAVEKITFDRAKNFLSGIKREEIGEKIVCILESENIVTACMNDTIRLKYDIFEDICFERFIDNQYDNCKSDYNIFFSNFEFFGRCIYRRYQIWVENKLFSKGNREKFLYKLLETDKVPEIWKTQTIIGIVKSNFCTDFFEEYSISRDLLLEFIRLTNIFAFETTILNLEYENVYSNLKPIGLGRPYLINLIYKSSIYQDDNNENHILKLCSDYSDVFIQNDIAVDSACQILEFHTEKKLENSLTQENYHIAEDINSFLLPIYKMAKNSKTWIKNFWSKRIQGYLTIDNKIHHIEEAILKYVLKNTVFALGKFLPEELCEIANTYWIKNPEYDKNDFYFRSSLSNNSKMFGLSIKADSYDFEYRNLYENTFLYSIIQNSFRTGLEWIIQLTNHAATSMETLSTESVYYISIWETSPQDKKNFICNDNFWLAGIQEHRVHGLISDAIFIFTQMVIKEINSKTNDKESVVKFAEYIKSEILKKSNNVMMLSVIAEIGRNCEQVTPGYSLFLASSIDLIMLDIQKITLLIPNSYRQLYEDLIFMSIGIPRIKNRYDIKVKESDSLQNHVIKMQLLGGDYQKKAESILDYLYSITPNEGKYAIFNLQIQKMDLRNATINKIDKHTYALIPQIKGQAKKIVEKNTQNEFNIEENTFQKIIGECYSLMKEEKFELQECLNKIEELQSLIEKSEVPARFQETLIMIIAYALTKLELATEYRSKLCCIWIDGIENIFNNNSFAFQIGLVIALFKQIEYEIEDIVKERLKRQMLNCFLYRGQNGIIFEISHRLKGYLVQNKKLAKCFFNTIIEIAEDNMAYFKYNVSKLNELGETIDYQPNRKKPPIWAEHFFKKNNIDLYQSRHERIIEKLLLKNFDKDLSNWNIEDCDIQTLCYVSNCGLDFRDNDFKFIFKKLFPYVISIICTEKNYHEYLDIYAICEIKSFIRRNLIETHNTSQLVDLLFDLHDFTKVTSDFYEFYEDISFYLLAVYFDVHNDTGVRKQCEETIKCIEKKISSISNDKVKNKLYRMLFLTLGHFHMDNCNWNKLHTEYSYKDKIFLNDIWTKYGWLHFKNFLYVIDQMHIKALLPEVLIPLNISLIKLKDSSLEYERCIKENERIINKIITKAFLDFNDEIKSDEEITLAFESFLSILVELNIEEAAVILDEFRVH